MLKEEYLQQLLTALYNSNALNVYDYTATNCGNAGEAFENSKDWTDELFNDKLAVYTDGTHTAMQITNFGKYWMLKGGYESFLKDSESMKKHHKDKDAHKENSLQKEKEELTEARLKLTHYRLIGFWLALIISCIGFILSLSNLVMLLNRNK